MSGKTGTMIHRIPQDLNRQDKHWKRRAKHSSARSLASTIAQGNYTTGSNDNSKAKIIVRSKIIIWIVSLVTGAAFTVWLLSLLWGGFLNLLAGTIWSRLDRIEVIGLERLNEQEVINIASVNIGANLIKLSKDSIAARVNLHPSVRQSRVITRLPGKLKIVVEERHPIALIVDEKVMLSDGEGVLFPLIDNVEVVDLPLLTGNRLTSENQIEDTDALSILNWLHDNYRFMYNRISEIEKSSDGYNIRIRHCGAKLKVDSVYDQATWEKLECFLTQQSQFLTADLKYVDLRFPDMIITGTEL